MGSADKVEKRPRLSFLISHAFLRGHSKLFELALAASKFADILIDSGAYTNYTKWIKSVKTGEPYDEIKVEEYGKACQVYDKYVWGYLTLDKINDPKTTWKQYNDLLNSGVVPIPIMQPGDTDDHYSFYLDHSKNKRVAVGGIAGLTASNSLNFGLAYYNHLYNLSGRTARIHTLGVLKWPQIFQLKGVRYTDTTTYAGGSRFGEIVRYDEMEGFTKIRFRNPAQARGRKYVRLLAHLKNCNITPKLLNDPDRYKGSGSIPSLSAIFAYLNFHRHAKERDLTYFFALSGLQWLTVILSVVDNAESDRFDYPAAAERAEEMRLMLKHDFSRAVENCMDIMRRKTRWRMRTK